jgi:phosphatidylglycerol---prolipoprotein diacylglyceryl transferase
MSTLARPETLADRLNRRFDCAVGVNVRLGGRLYGSWRVFSLAAFGVATIAWLAIGLSHDLSLLALALVPVVALAIFSAHRRTILRSGRPARLVFHRHALASAAVALPLLALLGSLSWRLIDTGTTAMLAGLAIGRLGCLRSGCCSGRPGRVGPRYAWLGDEHRRVPVQLLDLAACVLLVIAALVLHASDAAAGTATAVGLGGYFAIRLLLDELRDERVRTGRLTEAQRLAIAGALLVAAWALAFGV